MQTMAASKNDTTVYGREAVGIEVTPKAALTIREYLGGRNTLPIRIFLKTGGCGTQSLDIVPEAQKKSDAVFERNGFTYVIEPRLLRQYAPITIDSDGFSFRLSGKGISPPTGCGTCAFRCGSRGASRCTGVCITCETPCPTGLKILLRRKQRRAAVEI